MQVKKPSGAVIEVEDNEANRDYAELRGWVVLPPVKKKAVRKKAKK
jgi:hypothetical protein